MDKPTSWILFLKGMTAEEVEYLRDYLSDNKINYQSMEIENEEN